MIVSINQTQERRHECGSLLRRQRIQQAILRSLHGCKHIPGGALSLRRQTRKDGAPICLALSSFDQATSFKPTKHVGDIRPVDSHFFAQRDLIHVGVNAERCQQRILDRCYIEGRAFFEEQRIVDLVETSNQKSRSRPKRHALVERSSSVAFRRILCHCRSPSQVISPAGARWGRRPTFATCMIVRKLQNFGAFSSGPFARTEDRQFHAHR
jgi:hypothetical protein